MADKTRVVIMGAGGRDFHNYNLYFRDNPKYEVVAFTAAQIPGIVGKRYPASLAGKLYPSGIPILPEEDLEDIVKKNAVDLVVLAYSDLLYKDVGEKLSRALASGASFMILGPRDTMIPSSKPVIAVTAVRTGAGKSTVSKAIVEYLTSKGFKTAVIRHPMAYGDLERMAVQKFSTEEDLEKYNVTIEEREEYEQYIKMGQTVYAGVDYGKILEIAEREADIIHWDGGNNDWPFYLPDKLIVVTDAMRPGHELESFPGEVNFRMADNIIINKADQASPEAIEKIKANAKKANPHASVTVAKSVVELDAPELVEGKRVLVVEDSPTVTHGGLPYAAGYVAAKKYKAGEIIDPRPYAVGIIKKMYEKYPHMGPVLPSTGYSPEQLRDLEETIKRVPADTVILGTPADITRLINMDKTTVKVTYRIEVVEGPTIQEIVDDFLEKAKNKLGF
ncbi:MAG: cyclic 2,3-diphosphoglycerate synthase [Desulfurococcales archaeon]|nr:cyclic 2,3-diphosphoglycerate synthase [Desulfurococcales archaeon]